MLNKKGLIFTRPRDTVSFFVGLVLLALGLIPLLSQFGVIGFTLPGFLTGLVGSIFIWIIAVAGAYIVIDGFIEPPLHSLHWIHNSPTCLSLKTSSSFSMVPVTASKY